MFECQSIHKSVAVVREASRLLATFLRCTVWLIFVFLGFSVGCGNGSKRNAGGNQNTPSDVPVVVATTGMVADLVREVGGDSIRVEQLIGAGIDPHLFQPTRDDMQKIMAAELVVYSGHMLEGKLQATFEKLAKSQRIVAVTSQLAPSQLIAPHDNSKEADPHVWMDVSLWAECVDVVHRELRKLLPDEATNLQERAIQLKTRLGQLHDYGIQSIASIPKEHRFLLTSHDAFRYMGRAYDIEVEGIQGLSTESEASLLRINQLVDLLVARKIPAIFVESSVSPKNIAAIIDGARAQRHAVEIGGELFSDACGAAGTPEGTYIGMLKHNFDTITKALGGNTPAGFDEALGS